MGDIACEYGGLVVDGMYSSTPVHQLPEPWKSSWYFGFVGLKECTSRDSTVPVWMVLLSHEAWRSETMPYKADVALPAASDA